MKTKAVHTRARALIAIVGASVLGAALAAAGARAAEGAAQSTRAATSDQGRTWAQIAKLPNWQGIWQPEFGIDLAGPKALTPAAETKYLAYKQAQKQGEDVQPVQANCLPPGMPQIMIQPYPIEFLFNPGQVVILIEAYEQERTIFTDGRKHTAPDVITPTFQGDSIGHWDGDTLVVDTIGFVPHTMIAPGIGHSDQMHIIEHIRKIDPQQIEVRQTIIDPKVLAQPWTVVHKYKHLDDRIREYICEQNNRDSADAEGRPGERVGP
jgi:hypothetical protein